jgi:hypothetical protein
MTAEMMMQCVEKCRAVYIVPCNLPEQSCAVYVVMSVGVRQQ